MLIVIITAIIAPTPIIITVSTSSERSGTYTGGSDGADIGPKTTPDPGCNCKEKINR